MGTYYQTGDVLYFKTAAIPKGARKLKTDLFHQGDNHHHRVKGKFQIYKLGEDMFLECKGTCDLYHEEHETIKAKKGIYKKGIVMEYDHLLEESRKVVD